ncbi:MAG: flagellar motor switch protein FliG [Pseudomonadota bacterium]
MNAIVPAEAVPYDAQALTGPEKAAVIILALGEENARPLWESFDEDELREVTLAITQLGAVTSTMVESLMVDFVENIARTGPVSGSAATARRMLENILPKDKVDAILAEVKGPAGRTMWDKLSNVNPVLLARYLSKEHPQTIAVVLSRINPDHAAQVIAKMPGPMAEETVNRMLTLGPVQKDVLTEIEQTLQNEFITSLTETQGHDTFEMMAEIFNCFDRQTERRFMETLREKNPEAADRIKALMVVFEDLLHIDDHDVQILLRYLDKSQLAVALKGANDEVASLFFRNMSERAAKILRDDIDIMRPLRAREVEAVQQKIVEIAKQLNDEGKIFLSKRNEQEVIF